MTAATAILDIVRDTGPGYVTPRGWLYSVLLGSAGLESPRERERRRVVDGPTMWHARVHLSSGWRGAHLPRRQRDRGRGHPALLPPRAAVHSRGALGRPPQGGGDMGAARWLRFLYPAPRRAAPGGGARGPPPLPGPGLWGGPPLPPLSSRMGAASSAGCARDRSRHASGASPCSSWPRGSSRTSRVPPS